MNNANAGAGVLVALGTLALVVAALLRIGGAKLEGSQGWWSSGRGGQLLAAIFGWLALLGMLSAIRRKAYGPAGAFVVVSGCVFALRGLLVLAGWSGRGPLAII